MWVFLDDSGDCGMKFDNGSSNHVVMAACVFTTRQAVEHALQCVEEGRFNVAPDGSRYRVAKEFKYSASKASHKDAFFRAMRPAEFSVRVVVIDKRRLWSSRLISQPNHLKAEAIYQLLTHTDSRVRNAKLVIDGQDTRAFGVSDRQHFLARINNKAPGTLSTVEFADSRKNGLVQLADMVAGAVRRAVANPSDDAAKAHLTSFYYRTHRNRGGSYWPFK